MGRTVLRDIRSVTVGTTSTLLLPAREGRIVVFVGAPPPPGSPTTPVASQSGGGGISTTGVKVIHIAPAGVQERLVAWNFYTADPTAVAHLHLIRNGVNLIVDQGTSPVNHPVNLLLNGGDQVNVTIDTPGAAGSVADFVMSLESFNSAARVSLGFGAPAVLDAGLTIYAGQLPLLLPGAAVENDLFAVADAAGRPINVVDLFYQ